MDYLPEGQQVGEARPFIVSPGFVEKESNGLSLLGLSCIWLIQVAPLAAAHLKLQQLLAGAGEQTSLLILIAFIGTMAFSIFALALENSTHRPSSAEQGMQAEKHAHLHLLFAAAAALPLTFALLGSILVWGPSADMRIGLALLIIAAASAFFNGFCWFFSHFILRELNRTIRGLTEPAGPRSMFAAALSGLRSAKYSPPLYPALCCLILCSLFIFAFSLFSAHSTLRLFAGEGMSVVVIAFMFCLLGLVAFGRLHAIIALAQRERITSAAYAAGNAGPGSGILVGLGIAGIGLLTAYLPLGALVKIGDIFGALPPRGSPSPQPEALREGVVTILMRNLLSPSGQGWLPKLLLLVMMIFLTLLFWRRIKKLRLWEKLSKALQRAWRKILTIVKRFFPGEQSVLPAAVEEKNGIMPDEKSRLLDVFEHPEMLEKLSPAQIIISTFYLLLEYALQRGWLRKADRPPFELQRMIIERAGLDLVDLSCLTWAYAQAAYSQTTPAGDKLTEVRQAWVRLKPLLQSEPNPDEPQASTRKPLPDAPGSRQ